MVLTFFKKPAGILCLIYETFSKSFILLEVKMVSFLPTILYNSLLYYTNASMKLFIYNITSSFCYFFLSIKLLFLNIFWNLEGV